MSYMRDVERRRLDSIAVPANADVKRLADLKATFSALDVPPPILDLNYESRMALYGIETYTRAGTDTYTDMAGVGQTAAINTAAFDRQARLGLGWVVPRGLKTGSAGLAAFNPTGILPSTEYTLVIDVDRASAYSGAGTILSLNGGSVTNRVEMQLNTNYQPLFVVQAAGSVVVNAALGAVQAWYGGPRRLVLAVKSGAFAYSDDGANYGAVATGTMPAVANLTHMDIGGSAYGPSYFTGWIKRVQVLPFALSTAQVVNVAAGLSPLACWGDSLTLGTGTTGPANTFPELLRVARYPHSGVYNGGVGSETSTQIKTRMLADTIRKDWTSVFWTGRNNISNPAVVVADTDAMVANLTHNRFLVLSVINRSDGTENSGSAAYNQIAAVNAALAARYPNNYLDIRALIVAASGGSNDAPNATWTADGLHLTNTGYAYVASQVGPFLRGKNWY